MKDLALAWDDRRRRTSDLEMRRRTARWWKTALLCGGLAAATAEAADAPPVAPSDLVIEGDGASPTVTAIGESAGPPSTEGSTADPGATPEPGAELARLLQRAEALAKRADDREGEAAVDDARACGEAYLMAATRATEVGDARLAQESLFDAALCFERAHDHGASTAARQSLLAQGPEGALAAATSTALIDAALRFARFPEAASLAEDFVRRYAKEPGAKAHLERAIGLRIGLRQASEARRDVDLAAKLFGREDPAWVAGLAWALGELATDDDARVRHAEDYLRRYGDDGGVDRRLVAEVLIADDRWRRSCRVGDTLGLCVAPPAKSGSRSRCGPPPELRPAKRQARLAAEALERYERVRRFRWQSSPRAEERLLDGIPEGDRRRSQELSDALERAELAVTDAGFEELLAIELLGDLDFHVEPGPCERAREACRPRAAEGAQAAYSVWRVPSRAVDPAACKRSSKICRAQQKRAKDSRRRLAAVLKGFNQRSGELARDYEAIIRRNTSATAVLRGALRRGQLALHASALFSGAKLPRGFGEAAQKSFCDILRDQAEPYLEVGVQALTFCLDRALSYGIRDDSSEACEATLERLRPRQYPPLFEFIGAPTHVVDEVLEPRSVGVRLAAHGKSPVCSRAAIVGPLGFDETPLDWAVPQVSAGPRGAMRAGERAGLLPRPPRGAARARRRAGDIPQAVRWPNPLART